MPSIAMVVTFFGRAPLWMPAFLLSCRNNPDVQWILYTDVDLRRADVPPNVAVKKTTIRQLRRQSSAALGTSVDVRRTRKLCDLKVLYGVVFADDLERFDFWGCSDLDVIWGNFRTFATAERLRNYDIFSTGRGKLYGHCTLYRNTAAVNRVFERIPNYAALLASSHYEYLDERELTRALRSDVRVFWDDDLTLKADYLRALADESFLWKDGRTFDVDGRELMYVHFHKWKHDMTQINFAPGDRPRAFRITRQGFFA